MIQVYVSTEDLIPQPSETLEWAEKAFGKEKIATWDKGMKEHGFKKEKLLLVDWKGCIIDGNVRYWLAKKHNIKYVPIDYNFLVRDLNSHVHALAYKFTDKCKKESEELETMEKELRELIPRLDKTEDRQKRLIIKSMIEQIITKKELAEKFSDFQ